MSILLTKALPLIALLWPVVLSLVNQSIRDYLLTKYENHWLIQFSQVIDLSTIEEACAAYHKGSGRGSIVTHTVPQLVRALLVKYFYNLSYRGAEEMIDQNILLKFFVGYGLFENPMDHSTLQRFEIWVLENHPRLFFDEILRCIDALHPEDREQMQLVDTYAMLARGAKSSLITLIRDASRNLLRELKKQDPQRYPDLVKQLDLTALFGEEDEKLTVALSKEEREVRLQSVVGEVLRLHRLLSESLARLPFLSTDEQSTLRLRLGHLFKIISDETTVTANEGEDPDDVSVKERPHGEKGSYRIATANDPEATYREHGKNKPADLGYNASILTTEDFIREVQVDTGSQPDPVALPEMLESQQEHHDLNPKKVVGDQAYGNGKTRAQVEAVSDGQTTVIAGVPGQAQSNLRFSPADFTLSDDGFTLDCPNEVSSTKRYDNGKGDTFHFSPEMCQGCPFWQSAEEIEQHPNQPYCRNPKSKETSSRTVFISNFRPQIETAIEYNSTAQFKEEMKRRPIVERIIFNLTHIHGARLAKSVGLDKANFQARMAATTFNIRQLLRLRSRQTAPATA